MILKLWVHKKHFHHMQVWVTLRLRLKISRSSILKLLDVSDIVFDRYTVQIKIREQLTIS